MTRLAMTLLTVIEIVVVGWLLMIVPRITRRGLLFGVYVGEAASTGNEADAIRRSYKRGMIASMAVNLVVAIIVVAGFGIPLMGFVSVLILGGFVAMYLRAHSRACALAQPSGPAPGAAALVVQPPGRYLLPSICLVAAIAAGLFTFGYAWLHYDLLPERIPVHFGINGEPDGWADRSFAAVFLGPFATLVTGSIVGVVALLLANAKQAIRLDDGGVSLRAQERFRNMLTRLVSIVGLVVTAMMTEVSLAPIRVALGHGTGVHALLTMILGGGILALTISIVVLSIRYGQGGARLEAAAAGAPLTNGLADNRYWRLGMFYVNPDDPSIMVEQRFGIGYTINLGHWKGIALLTAMIILPLTIVAVALFAVLR